MRRYAKVLFTLLCCVIAVSSLFACGGRSTVDDDYVAYTLSDVVMVQTGVNSYDFALSADCAGDDARVYLTEVDRLRSSDAPVKAASTEEGDKVRFTFSVDLNLSEEYYLWVVSGEKEVMLPITAPSMFPSMEIRAAGGAIFHYNFTYGVSWSSICDPEGKAVYVSDKSEFDQTAEIVLENVKITENDSVIQSAKFDENKFYYSVTTAKNGLLKIISSPVMLATAVKSQLSSVSARLTDGAVLEVTVAPKDDSSLASSQASGLQLVVKSGAGDEIYSADCVWENGKAAMSFDCTKLLKEDLWYDMCLAYRGAIICDVPKTLGSSSVVGVSSTKKDGIKYSITDWKPDGADDSEAGLKVYFAKDSARYADEFCRYAVSLVVEDGVPVLVVTGTLKSQAAVPELAITSGDTTPLAKSAGVGDGANFECRLALADVLTVADRWYDIRLIFGSVCTDLYKDSCMSYDDFAAEKTCGGRTYSFREYDGLLKIMFA